MEKGMHGGIPKLRCLSLLEYFLGMHGGIPKLERLTLLNLLSSSSLAHLKTPSYITHHNLISEVSTHNKIIFSLLENKDILVDLLFLKISKKFLLRKSKLKGCKTKKRQNMTESVKNRPAGSK